MKAQTEVKTQVGAAINAPAQSSQLPAYTEAEVEAALDSLTEQEQE